MIPATKPNALGVVLLLAAGAVWAQDGPRPNPRRDQMNGPWWRAPRAAHAGLNAQQHRKLDDIWQQHRLRRIDLEAAVQKAQVTLEPLWQADSPDEAKILAQADHISQAQAEVRKDEIRMQLAARQILDADQWRKTQEHGQLGPGSPQPGAIGSPEPNGPPPRRQTRPPLPPWQ